MKKREIAMKKREEGWLLSGMVAQQDGCSAGWLLSKGYSGALLAHYPETLHVSFARVFRRILSGLGARHFRETEPSAGRLQFHQTRARY